MWDVNKKHGIRLAKLEGGNLRNAIAREAHAVIAIPETDKHAIRTELNVFAAEVEAEYAVTDPDMQFILESEAPSKKDSYHGCGRLQFIRKSDRSCDRFGR